MIKPQVKWPAVFYEISLVCGNEGQIDDVVAVVYNNLSAGGNDILSLKADDLQIGIQIILFHNLKEKSRNDINLKKL